MLAWIFSSSFFLKSTTLQKNILENFGVNGLIYISTWLKCRSQLKKIKIKTQKKENNNNKKKNQSKYKNIKEIK